MAKEELAPSRKLAAKVIYAAFQILKEHDGQQPGKEIILQIAKRVTLDDWAKAKYEKSGYIRWQSILHFFSIDCIKAGYLLKKKGIWYLTPEGERAIELGEILLLQTASAKYKEWASTNIIKESESIDTKEGLEEASQKPEKLLDAELDEIEQRAFEGLKEFIYEKNAYEFQDLAAALFRGMGYYTPFVAPKGKDGGIDIVAYKDPLGAELPRFKVQVKHRENPASVDEIRQLMGLLQKNGDTGIFISTGGFTQDSKSAARNSLVHIELIDLPRFRDLWLEFYTKLNDEDKSMLPLRPIHFLATKGI